MSVVQPNDWAALKLPSDCIRILQVIPNTTISLGKYGSFPSNLIIHRPFHITYELQDKRPGENFCRLRPIPPKELYADIIAEESCDAPLGDEEDSLQVADTDALPDREAINDEEDAQALIDENERQTLTMQEIEELKREGGEAGQELVAKLILSHKAIDLKTNYSLAKYKLLKLKKYVRRFQVLPADVPLMGNFMLEEKDATKILSLREEIIALLGCLANVHYGGPSEILKHEILPPEISATTTALESQIAESPPTTGRWLVVDDTGGLLVAAMAERMGVLYPAANTAEQSPEEIEGERTVAEEGDPSCSTSPRRQTRSNRIPKSDFEIPYSTTNNIALIHSASQPNLSFLRHYGFDATDPNPLPDHPLSSHVLTLSWLQLLQPELDTTYSTPPPVVESHETLMAWRPNRRGNYHRKRRRWARTQHCVRTTRAGGFSGLVCASTMDPISILRYTLPLLAGGAPVAIYSPSLEPLAELADCFSISRRSAWADASNPPVEIRDKTNDELKHWQGNDDFPLNPSLLINVGIHTTRARHWQVLPQRTHPLMMSRGGPEGYIFTGIRAIPVEGRIEARGKFQNKRRKVQSPAPDHATTPSS